VGGDVFHARGRIRSDCPGAACRPS
jgi:hypothetical protein